MIFEFILLDGKSYSKLYIFLTVWGTRLTSQVELYLIKLIKKISESKEINKIVIEKNKPKYALALKYLLEKLLQA